MSIQTRTTAVQNEVVRLYYTFEYDGRLANPASQPLVEIIDTDGATVLDSVSAQIEHTGIWYADWYVPADLPLGNYYDRWTFQWNTTSGVIESVLTFSVYGLDSYINFISPGISHNITDRTAQLMNDLSNNFIYEAMHIPVYFEQAMRTQQENQKKRIKKYYYFTLDSNSYSVEQGAVYFNNSQRFTVWETITPYFSSSSSSGSSSSSESLGNVSTSSSSVTSSSSIYSESSNSQSSVSISSSSSNSSSSESIGNVSTSSSSAPEPFETTSETSWTYKTILTCVGTGTPSSSGTLTKVNGTGPTTIGFVSYEQKTSRFSTIYSMAYKNWNKDPRPILRKNNTVIDDGWYVDYDGRLFVDGLTAPEDSFNIAYNFRYFGDEEILSFLNLGLMMMNSVPPASVVYPALSTMPTEWNAPVLLYAAVTALKRLIFGISWQEKAIIYGKPEDAKAVAGILQQLYADYMTLWTETKKDAKTRKLPGMAIYITPEYTMPGGRCMSSDTCIKCKVDNKKAQNITIKDIFNIFEKGKDIKVLSLNNDKMDYISVGKVWQSGIKKTYIIKAKDAQIRLTKEHMVYLPETKEYKPVMNLVAGDSIYVLKGKKLKAQKILFNPEPYNNEEVYDIEVPETENFIGNNIVSHNSRFFRYMYKTGS